MYHGKKVSVKPLEIIWNQLKYYGSHNTVHVDDSDHNFRLNPRQGLKILPFKGNQNDCELGNLGEYLIRLAHINNFNDQSHENWGGTVFSKN